MNQIRLDSLYNKFLQLRAPELLPQTNKPVELSLEDRKCGFETVTDVKSNLDNFSPEQKDILLKILSRPTLQTSIVSPSGIFRIHYDQTGFNRPAYISGLSPDQNAMEVAEALDSVYRFEIVYLGYPLPPGDNGAGGDDKYDIYIINQSAGLYGYTEPESKVGSVNWTSFVVIDNDYVGYYSSGIDGMLVTVAHEFHHGVQVGSYAISDVNSPYRNSDVFFYELTSTSMEEFVYDTVNDYYAYMSSYFQNPDKAMPSQNGYNLAIWNLFLQERFGFAIIKQQWELIPSINAITAINNTIQNVSSSLPSELNNFGIWTFFTNYRTISGSYFEEASHYPLIKPTIVLTFTPPQQTANVNSHPAANNFLKFNIDSTDTIIALVSNGDAIAALQNPNQSFGFEYTLYADTISGTRKLSDNYSSNFNTGNIGYWSVSEFLIDTLVYSDSVLIPIVNSNESLAFPNPFYYSIAGGTEADINIALNLEQGTDVDFNVYSIGLQIVYSESKTVVSLRNNSPGIYWNGLDNKKNKLASGVYVYIIKQGDVVIKGKVVIFNE